MTTEAYNSLVSATEKVGIWIPAQFSNLNSFQLQIQWIDSEISLNKEEKQRRQELINRLSNIELEKIVKQKNWLIKLLLPLKDEFTKYKDEIDKAFLNFIENNWQPFLSWISDLESSFISIIQTRWTFKMWQNDYENELWNLLFYRFAYNFLRKKQEKEIEELDKNEAINVIVWIARDLYNEISLKRRWTLSDDLFAVWKWIDPNSEEPRKLCEEVDWEIWQNFDAHGISKTNQFENLISLLQNGIDPNRTFYTWPFSLPKNKVWLWAWIWTSSWTAYKDWISVVTSWYKETIQGNWIKYVFINDVFIWLERILQWVFPQYQFHLLSQQKQVMENEARQKQS